MTDPIADMLTRIRNASSAHKEAVLLPYSNVKYIIAKILQKEGYLATVEKKGERDLSITIRFVNEEPAIREITRISKPGCRVYVKKEDLPTVLSANGIAVVSTSQGMMTNVEAKARSLGGEIVCEVF
jgi:small subunit ribosomal protein S8